MTDEEDVVAPLQAAEAAPPEVKDPKWQVVDNAISATLLDQYGFLPLTVRYDAAEAARRVVDAWREEGA